MEHPKTTATDLPKWSALLIEAVTKPGLIMKAYSAFHPYSCANQLLALFQIQRRGLRPGPLNTFPKWKELGRFVNRGERALTLCMPITCKRREENSDEEHTFTSFVYNARWFTLSQTDGQELDPIAIPEWHANRALAALSIERVPFDHTDGNIQGFAKQRQIAINPLAQLPFKTLCHELGHLCCLRSYVVLRGQVVWNEAPTGSGLYITFSPGTYRWPLLFAGLSGLTFHAVEEK